MPQTCQLPFTFFQKARWGRDLKVALVHDYLVRFGGAERVVLALRKIFPKAPVYTLLYDEEKMGEFFKGAEVRTSFLQKFPKFLRKHYQVLAPLMPSAVETLDLREFDLVISSSSAFSKGLVLRPKTIHICYCHNPTRFLWDYSHEYQSRWPSFRKILFHYLRLWDKSAANRVDYFLANSKITALRIKKYYGREAKVIYPPVQTIRTGQVFFRGVEIFAGMVPSEAPRQNILARGEERRAKISPQRKSSLGIFASLKSSLPRSLTQEFNDYFLIVSQLTPYKRIDLAIEAFNKLELPLVIIGEGKDRKRLEKMAKENVKFLGFLPDKIINQYYQNCIAFIFPGEDDFGLAPVEAMSFGKPVLAYRAGGATETILEGMTGEFFDDLASESLADGVRRLKMNFKNYSPIVIRKRAERFSEERFNKEIVDFVEKVCYSINKEEKFRQ